MDAKTRWRLSSAGKAYHEEYHKKYSSNPENRKRKADAQRLRRQTSPARKEIDKKHNYSYVRRPEVKAKKNEARRLRRQTDMQYRVTERLRGRIKDLLKRNKPRAVSKSLGCSAEQLMKHLEKQFQPGMTWDNYGFTGWHIDHIKPLAAFDLTKEDQFKVACHYTNLRPLWAIDNLRKGAKIESDDE